jgi:tRNA1(Val) A37 N6-methylase TrmN6
VTDDAFLGGALHILQPRRGYRAGVDAVLLAAAAPLEAGRGERVLDCGAGVGTVGLCVAARVADARVVLFEREPQLVAIAAENIRRNELSQRVRVIEGDVRLPAAEARERGLDSEGFAHVLANPPFYADGEGSAASDPLKAASHAMKRGDLELWARFLARMAAPGGSATLIGRAEALGELIGALEGRFGGVKILPVHPREGMAAIRVIVQGFKGSRAPARLLCGLVLHGADSAFTPLAGEILRCGRALSL